MPRLTATAERQLEELLDWYIARERFEAADNQQDAVAAAFRQIDTNPGGGLAAPRMYASLSAAGYRWLKQGRYWFAWSNDEQGPIVTNVFFETANILGRISDQREPT